VGRGARAEKAHPLYIHTYKGSLCGALCLGHSLVLLRVNFSGLLSPVAIGPVPFYNNALIKTILTYLITVNI
jgi:hypothetical protein